jgi:hypothetical protein
MSTPNVRRIDPAELRPRRLWYGVGAAVFALAVVVGVAGFAVMIVRMTALPDFVAEVRGPGEAVFTVDEEFGQLGLYSSPAGADERSCTVALPDGGERAFDWPAYSHSVESGGTSWSLVGAAESAGPGEYTLVCDGDPDVLYALGDLRDGGRTFALEFAGTMTWILGVPFLGLVLGGTVLVVTGARRNAHHRRLLAERVPPYGHG